MRDAASLFLADAGRSDAPGDYQPGICNIGPTEIARRRRVGHVGALAALAIVAVLIIVDAPPLLRLLAMLPATVSAAGYLQAWLRFCAAFGWRGVFNFGGDDEVATVRDERARAADRRRASLIGFAALALGIVVGVAAFLLPV